MVRFYRSSPSAAWELPVPTDPATVAANASGLLTPQQQAQLLAALTADRPQGAARVVQLAIGLPFVVGVLACIGLSLLGPLPELVRGIAQPGISDLSGLLFAALLFVLFTLLLFFGLIVTPLRTGVRRRRIQREVEAGRVAQAEGEVSVRRSGYVARAGGRTLRSPTGQRAVLLAPGIYSFYFLPATGVLVSAEPRPGPGVMAPGPGAKGPELGSAASVGASFAPNAPPQAALVAALGEALHFSTEDLILNRQGRMSEAQRRRLTGWTAFLVVFGLVLCIVAPAIFIVMFSSWQATCPVLICVLIGSVVLYGARLSRRDVVSGAVTILRGPVQRTIATDGEGSRSYYYVIGTMRFSVRRQAYDALIPGLPYAVYFSPRSQRILSIEPLSPPPTAG